MAVSFGRWLRIKRMSKDVSLREFASRIGVSPTYLCHIETGKSKPPSERRLKAISENLHVDHSVVCLLAGKIPPDMLRIIRHSPERVVSAVRKVGRAQKGKA